MPEAVDAAEQPWVQAVMKGLGSPEAEEEHVCA